MSLEKKARQEMLEREIYGIDIELQTLRARHQSDTANIAKLEEARSILVAKLDKTYQLELPLEG